MQENYDLVQKGFRILVASMSGYIGQEMNRVYKDEWWNEVLYTLSDQRDLPASGTYSELIDSLDVANCIRLIKRKWIEVFNESLPRNCKTWADELMGVRNIVAHIGQQDLDQPIAERALDTMVLLCKEIDTEGADEIHELYNIVRGRADHTTSSSVHTGSTQLNATSNQSASINGGLLQLIGTDAVQTTTLTRKVAFGGKTVVYPVYRVRLDHLYYNDQNDRIATWITRYETENGTDALGDLNVEIYNRIIETFICESNPEAIKKTQNNIDLVGQREPGVTLADGRIVDGNRRYTCLRRLQRGSTEPVYFETVIMDMDIHVDRKQIKLLELSIQHGEEGKVDYDPIDYAIGTYRDVVQTGLLTAEEYAASTNESVADVKKRLEIAGIVCEFLTYIKLPEQYHVAREYQLHDIFTEMMAPLHQLPDEGKQQLKEIVFQNTMMGTITDQRKFIRNIKNLIKSDTYAPYFEEQQRLGEQIRERLDAADIHSKDDVIKFAEDNAPIKDELQQSMESAMVSSRNQVLKNRPVENVSKCISLLTDVDSRLFVKMDEEEKENLRAELDEMERIVTGFKKMLSR